MSSDRLKPSGDRKVRAYKNQKNTFGLLPGPAATCPGATTSEGGCAHVPAGRKLSVCYAARLVNARPNVRAVLEHNTKLLTQASGYEQQALLQYEFERFLQADIKKRPKEKERYYRLHWSGDIFSKEYANALASAMLAFPEISFWNYTRSFEWLQPLREVPNCVTYLSLDKCNSAEGTLTYRGLGYPEDNMSLCMMSPLEPRSNYTACPQDSGKLELEGACHKCKLCLKGKPVWFKTK
jgi:hypothetical protein